MREVDVAIIGAGTAGLSARREVAKHTDNYVVIDDGPLGTTCARVGCMPSKVLIQIANDYHRRHKFAEMGIQGKDSVQVDIPAAMAHVRKLRDRFVRGVNSSLSEWRDTHLIRKRAKFISSNTLDLGDEKIKAKNVIIATGSSPVIPNAWKKYSKYFISTDEFFEMEDLPEDIAVIGLGVIGIELGQALSRLGINVVGFSLDKAIGGASDPEIQEYIADSMEKEFPIHYGLSEIVDERNGKLVVKSGIDEIAVDKAFLTMGRTPNLRKLDLEKTGIKLNEKGLPHFSKNSFNIEGTRIFIAGDSNADRSILHEAADEGRIAGYNAVREELQCFQRRELLAITFSDPNIATVGKGYRELVATSTDFVTGKVSFEGQGRAIVKLKEKGLMHIYAEKKTGRLLGAELFAPEGEHLAHLLVWAVSLKLTAREALALPFYHPVLEEGMRTAIRDLANQVDIDPTVLEVLRCEDPPIR